MLLHSDICLRCCSSSEDEEETKQIEAGREGERERGKEGEIQGGREGVRKLSGRLADSVPGLSSPHSLA